MAKSADVAVALCSRWQLPKFAPIYRPRVALTFMDPGALRPRCGSYRPEHWEVIEVHDLAGKPIINDRRWIIPAASHVARVVDLANEWAGRGGLVVTCDAGISRSSAGVLIVATALRPKAVQLHCETLRRIAPWVEPNSLMIELADRLLGMRGRLCRAVAAMGSPLTSNRPRPVCLPLTAMDSTKVAGPGL